PLGGRRALFGSPPRSHGPKHTLARQPAPDIPEPRDARTAPSLLRRRGVLGARARLGLVEPRHASDGAGRRTDAAGARVHLLRNPLPDAPSATLLARSPRASLRHGAGRDDHRSLPPARVRRPDAARASTRRGVRP